MFRRDRARKEPEGFYEMMIAIINELKNINKRCYKDCEEFIIRMKEHEERKESDAT